MKKTALITGATSGIGKATARAFASQKIDLILCGRRQDALNELETELSELVSVTTLCFDISDKTEVFKQIESLPNEFMQIDILVNNAGNAHGMDSI